MKSEASDHQDCDGTGGTSVHHITDLLLNAYAAYRSAFNVLTASAEDRFLKRQWADGRKDAVQRLGLYTDQVMLSLGELRRRHPSATGSVAIWEAVKSRYAEKTSCHDDRELTRTFFNSIVRRVFGTVGVAPSIEFTSFDFVLPLVEDKQCRLCKVFLPSSEGIDAQAFQAFLQELCPRFWFKRLATDTQHLVRMLEHIARKKSLSGRIHDIEVMDSIFYRDRAAYLIGRYRIRNRLYPLVIALLNESGGVIVDAVLLTRREVSILFSFTRADFQVAVSRPREMISFIKTIIPLKRESELYTSIGFYKHGKSELYREVNRSLAATDDRFEIAPGQKGMVMAVFTLSRFDVVFKVIRDRFEYPKNVNPDEVKKRYKLVFQHDRAGRLVDAQEFEHLSFSRQRFSTELMHELSKTAANTVHIRSDDVVIRHVYTERRLTPLDIFIRQAKPAAAEKAVLDYGQAIKELAASNIFPGDLLLKNFGVTRSRRVVFYDYDELTLLSECRFREMPEPLHAEDELAAEPWFQVNENDVFPEEFRRFLGLPRDLLAIFEARHADLFTVAFWRTMQEQIEAGKLMHIFPYADHRRFYHFYE